MWSRFEWANGAHGQLPCVRTRIRVRSRLLVYHVFSSCVASTVMVRATRFEPGLQGIFYGLPVTPRSKLVPSSDHLLYRLNASVSNGSQHGVLEKLWPVFVFFGALRSMILGLVDLTYLALEKTPEFAYLTRCSRWQGSGTI